MVGKYFYISVINKNVRFGGCGLYRFVGRCGLKIKLCTICTIGHSSVIPPKAKIKQKIFTPKYFPTLLQYLTGGFLRASFIEKIIFKPQKVISRVCSPILRLLEVAEQDGFSKKTVAIAKNGNNRIISPNLNEN